MDLSKYENIVVGKTANQDIEKTHPLVEPNIININMYDFLDNLYKTLKL